MDWHEEFEFNQTMLLSQWVDFTHNGRQYSRWVGTKILMENGKSLLDINLGDNTDDANAAYKNTTAMSPDEAEMFAYSLLAGVKLIRDREADNE